MIARFFVDVACVGRGWRPGLKNDLPVPIDNADMRLFHRDVQSGKILHGCSLLFTSESRYYRLSGSSRICPMSKNVVFCLALGIPTEMSGRLHPLHSHLR